MTAVRVTRRIRLVGRVTRRRLYTVPLMLALAAVVSSQCLLSGHATPEERACCAAMKHDCGSAGIEAQCCTGEIAKITAPLPLTASLLEKAPASTLLAVLTMPEPGGAHGVLHQPVGHASASPPGSRPHLLSSNLRI